MIAPPGTELLMKFDSSAAVMVATPVLAASGATVSVVRPAPSIWFEPLIGGREFGVSGFVGIFAR